MAAAGGAYAAASPEARAALSRRRRRAEAVRRYARSPGVVFGLVVLALVVSCALFAELIAPQDPLHQDLVNRLQPPMTTVGGKLHLLGTDLLGRDVLSRIIHGSRISLTIGLSSVLVGGLFGILLGLLAGYYGGWIDAVTMRLVDLQLSIPFLVLAIAVIAILGPSLQNIIIVLALTGWVTYARVVRGEALAVRERDYILAVRALGATNWRLMFAHLLPNVAPSFIVIATLEVARMITTEAALSYLGLGVQPPTPAWGTMVFEGQAIVPLAPWVSILPGLAILLTVLAINLLGDWLRELLDPRLSV